MVAQTDKYHIKLQVLGHGQNLGTQKYRNYTQPMCKRCLPNKMSFDLSL